MHNTISQLGRRRLGIAVAAVALIGAAWVQVVGVGTGVTIRALERHGVPMTFMAPGDAQRAPGVLIAHGFGGSRQLMLAYAQVLVSAGYGVMLWDFAGHAASRHTFAWGGKQLQVDLATADEVLREQPEIDATRIALLGHSMGTQVVMQAGIRAPERYVATVAVSPIKADVTAHVPPNLQLQAGVWEPRFAANAATLLAQAGGDNRDFAGGRARALVMIPGVEHIAILFSAASHRAALHWLNRSFDRDVGTDYRDWRMVWFVVHLAAALLLLLSLAPVLRQPAQPPVTAASWWRGRGHWLAGLAAPGIASGLLLLLGAQLDIRALGGVLVSGALGLWFVLVGLIWLGAGFRGAALAPTAVRGHHVLWGLALFGFLWLAFGLLAHWVWLPWLLTPARLLRWPLLALACVPWLLAAALAQHGQSRTKRLIWWLLHSVALAAGLLLGAPAVPGFALLVPLLPAILGLFTITAAAFTEPWINAIGNALFLSWLLLAYAPLAG